MSDLVIKKLNHNTIDAFIGTGWENWSRWKIKFGKEKNELFQVKGIRFPQSKINELVSKYNQPK